MKRKNIYHTLQTQLRMCGGQKQGDTIYQNFTQLDVKNLILQPKTMVVNKVKMTI